MHRILKGTSEGKGMKTTMFLAAATLLPGVFLMQASGGTNVAVIDFDRAVSEAPGGKDAINKMTEFQNQQVAAITTKQKEAVDLENRLRTQERTLTESARTELTKNLETARTNIQTMQEDAQRKITQMRQELLLPVEQKTAMAVSTYAAEHNLKIVLDASALQGGLVYVHDTADITSEIIRRIASDLQAPKQHAAAEPDRLLNRNWLGLRVEQR
jgi:Skp family chaperone for outer membrane proteins